MNKIIIAVIGVAVVAIGGYFLITATNRPNAPAEQANQQEENPIVEIILDPVSKTHEVAYTDGGYAPGSLTIKKGDTVVFKNQSSAKMWVASAMHPTHIVYGGTSLQAHCPDNENNAFDQCQSNSSGESWEFTFNKSGEWGYHNHSSAQHFGKIIVR